MMQNCNLCSKASKPDLWEPASKAGDDGFISLLLICRCYPYKPTAVLVVVPHAKKQRSHEKSCVIEPSPIEPSIGGSITHDSFPLSSEVVQPPSFRCIQTHTSPTFWVLDLCMGAQASIIPESFSWLSRVTSFTQRREPIPPVSVGWVAMYQSHMCGLCKVFIGTYLSFREVKPRVRLKRCLNTLGSEAVLKVQLQRRAGKNHV